MARSILVKQLQLMCGPFERENCDLCTLMNEHIPKKIQFNEWRDKQTQENWIN